MAITLKSKTGNTDKTLVPRLYKFGTTNEGNASMKDVLGGKGANLAEMGSIGIRVPDGFTIPCATSVLWTTLSKHSTQESTKVQLMEGLMKKVKANLDHLETVYGYMPLLSVRSGARVSMPGMMDTILNVGITNDNLEYWKTKLGERTALDSYRRLIMMYSTVALGLEHEPFDTILEEAKQEANVTEDSQLSADELNRVVKRYLQYVFNWSNGAKFPQTVEGQIEGSIKAVFESWNNPRAVEYRKIHNIPDDWGTAVNIQSMVFGNMNDQSATGVLFSRDPSTGEKVITGEYLVNAQGEDVVAGIRTPLPLTDMKDWNSKVYLSLRANVDVLEKHYRDMQDIEFTIQDGELYILQTRNGKRSAKSAFKVAHDMATEGLITKSEAVSRVNQEQLMAIMQDVIDPSFKTEPNFTGIAAGGGLVQGVIALTAESAVNCTVPCILVTKETDPNDIAGMHASVGILTATGGLTSHAAVVARGMNKACVVGATTMQLDVATVSYGEGVYASEGETITIDGATGRVWFGEVPVIAGGMTPEANTIILWATEGSATKIDLDHTQHNYGLDKVKAKNLYLTTALLVPDRAAVGTLNTNMQALGGLLQKLKTTMLVIDLKTRTSHYDQADRTMAYMFGESFVNGVTYKADAVVQNWGESLKSKVVFVNAEEETDTLIKAGWRVNGKVKTVADLYASHGTVDISSSTITALFGSVEVYEKVKAMVEKEKGVKFHAGAPAKYWFEALEKEA